MVGVDEQWQFGGPANAICLIGKLTQRQHDQVGRTEYGQRRHRAGKHAQFEAQIRGNARGNRVVHGGGVHARSATQNGTKLRAASAPARRHVFLPDGGKRLALLRTALLTDWPWSPRRTRQQHMENMGDYFVQEELRCGSCIGGPLDSGRYRGVRAWCRGKRNSMMTGDDRQRIVELPFQTGTARLRRYARNRSQRRATRPSRLGLAVAANLSTEDVGTTKEALRNRRDRTWQKKAEVSS